MHDQNAPEAHRPRHAPAPVAATTPGAATDPKAERPFSAEMERRVSEIVLGHRRHGLDA